MTDLEDIFNIKCQYKEYNVAYNLLNRTLRYVTIEEFDTLDDHFLNDKCFDNQDIFECVIKNYNEAVNSKRLHLVIMCTTACNFSCQYCYEDYKEKTIDDKFCNVLLLYLQDGIHQFDSVYIEWFGGEPLLVKDKIIELSNKINQICKSNNISYISSITTNGYLLDYNTFERMLDAKIVHFQVTIDGDKLTHDHLRPLKTGEGSFEKIFNNLLDIHNKVNFYRYFKLVIRNNVYANNMEECSRFIDVFKEFYSNDPRFYIFQYPIKNWGGERIKEISEEILSQSTTIYDDKNIYSFSDLTESRFSTLCYAARKNGFVIDPDLDIYKCSHQVQKLKSGNMSSRVGYLNENGKLVIDQSIQEQCFQRDISDYCKKCKFISYCIYELCPSNKMNGSLKCAENREIQIKRKIILELKKCKGIL